MPYLPLFPAPTSRLISQILMGTFTVYAWVMKCTLAQLLTSQHFNNQVHISAQFLDVIEVSYCHYWHILITVHLRDKIHVAGKILSVRWNFSVNSLLIHSRAKFHLPAWCKSRNLCPYLGQYSQWCKLRNVCLYSCQYTQCFLLQRAQVILILVLLLAKFSG